MNNEQLLNLIKIWNDDAIRIHHVLQKENNLCELPQWYQGYLACLEDLKNIINKNK